MTKMASLILEDGTTFKGLLFGADVSVSGEVGKSKTQNSFVSSLHHLARPLSLTPDRLLFFFFFKSGSLCVLSFNIL